MDRWLVSDDFLAPDISRPPLCFSLSNSLKKSLTGSKPSSKPTLCSGMHAQHQGVYSAIPGYDSHVSDVTDAVDFGVEAHL